MDVNQNQSDAEQQTERPPFSFQSTFQLDGKNGNETEFEENRKHNNDKTTEHAAYSSVQRLRVKSSSNPSEKREERKTKEHSTVGLWAKPLKMFKCV